MNLIKVVMLGAPGVGKTAIVERFTTGQFNESYHSTTIKNSHYVTMVVNDRAYHLRINDIPAIPRFPLDSLEEWTHFRHYGLLSADAYLLVFDINSLETFKYIRFIRDQLLMVRSAVPPHMDKWKPNQGVPHGPNLSNGATASFTSPFNQTMGNANSSSRFQQTALNMVPLQPLSSCAAQTLPKNQVKVISSGMKKIGKDNQKTKNHEIFRPLFRSWIKKKVSTSENASIATPTTTTNSFNEPVSPILILNDNKSRLKMDKLTNKEFSDPLPQNTPIPSSKTLRVIGKDTFKVKNEFKKKEEEAPGPTIRNLASNSSPYLKCPSFRDQLNPSPRLMDTLAPSPRLVNRGQAKGFGLFNNSNNASIIKHSPKQQNRNACSKLLAASSILNLNAYVAGETAQPPTSPSAKNNGLATFTFGGGGGMQGQKFAIVVVANKADKAITLETGYSMAPTSVTSGTASGEGNGPVYREKREKEWASKQRKARKAAAAAIRKTWKCPYVDHCSAKRDWSITAVFAETLRAVIKAGAAGAADVSTDPTEILLLNAPNPTALATSNIPNLRHGGLTSGTNMGGSGVQGLKSSRNPFTNRKYNKLFSKSPSSPVAVGSGGSEGKAFFARWIKSPTSS